MWTYATLEYNPETGRTGMACYKNGEPLGNKFLDAQKAARDGGEFSNARELTAILELLGKEGWEMVGSVPDQVKGLLIIFKRPFIE